jgi:hypothetical protein
VTDDVTGGPSFFCEDCFLLFAGDALPDSATAELPLAGYRTTIKPTTDCKSNIEGIELLNISN